MTTSPTSEPFDLLATPLTPGVTLLEASAGTGKTYALAAIFLRLVAEEGLAVSQIVVTTYTIPATAELRDRIRGRLVEAAGAMGGTPATTPFVADLVARHAGSTEVRARLDAAVRDFDEASISTIHGFCQRTLRERSFESGQAPDAEMVPDHSALIMEVAEDYWRKHFSETGSVVAPLALLTGLVPEGLTKLYQHTASQPTARLVPKHGDPDDASATAQTLLTTLRAQWPGWRDGVRRLFLDSPTWAIGQWKKRAVIEPQFDLIERLAADGDAPLPCYAGIRFFQPSHIVEKKGVSARALPPSHPFCKWCEDFAAALDSFAAEARAHFLQWARGEIATRKEARGVMGFEDLLMRLHSALSGPGGEALATAVRKRFAASLVDEFQDTDPTQDAIFRRLFAEDPTHRLFLIGDPKQAIYGFRGADLFTYLAARDRAHRRFALDTNHRSDAALVEAANHLFSRHPAPFIEDIPFAAVKAQRDPSERPLLVEGTARPPMRFAFWEEEKPIASGRAEAQLPGVTAGSVARLLATSTLRGVPLKPSDIAVLCWKNAQCQAVQAALSAKGIPAVVLSSSSVLASDEAREMGVLVAALAKPTHEQGVRAALATSLFGMDAAALDALGDNAAAWEAQLATFGEAHARWRDRGFIQMFRELLRDTHARERLLGLPSGERRLTNFLHLAELLHGAAREHSLGPAALARWFAQEAEDATDSDASELRLESDEDAVKVLTIHKSKGLEWPVVLCPYLWTKAGLRESDVTLYHEPDGAPVLDLGTPGREAARAAASHERLAEQVRLLYVALTRARHETHVVWGNFNGAENTAMMWLLEPPPSASATKGNAPAMLESHAGELDAAHLRSTLQALVQAAPGSFACGDLWSTEGGGTSAQPSLVTAPEPVPLAARVFAGAIDRTWKVSSFSALVAGVEDERDRDADDRPRVELASLEGIHAFSRGARAGVCLHEIFEELDFTNDTGIEPLVNHQLQKHAFLAPLHGPAVSECVRNTLSATLGSATLRELPRQRTLRELEFLLPAGMLTPTQIHAATGEDVEFDARRGVLTGFIDLVFEHGGRYHIVDWKSNWLGPTAEDYHARAVEAEMARHRYGLQWKLYMVALHRFLAMRLRDYSPARHLGDVFYLFLRGITPGRPDLGIFHATQAAANLPKLEALFPV